MIFVERLLQRLELTRGDMYAQAAVAAESVLMLQPQLQRDWLSAAFDGAAVLHWFDAGLLSQMLGSSLSDARERLTALDALPFVEPYRKGSEDLRNVHEVTRIGWRRQLAREAPERWRALCGRAAAWFAKDGSTAARIEWIYHSLSTEPDRAATELEQLYRDWGRATRPEEQQAFATALAELENSGLLKGRARVWALLVIARNRGSRGEDAQLEAVGKDILQLARVVGDRGAEAKAQSLLGGVFDRHGEFAMAQEAFVESRALALRLAPVKADSRAFTDYDYSNFYYGAGDDLLNLLGPFAEWYRQALPNGYHLYSQPLASAPGVRVRVRNRKTGIVQELLNLASCNYLGISYREEVKQAAIEAVHRYGLGASGSPILSGTFEIHHELADAVASFKDKPAAILFPTGYSANVGFISALMRPGDNILCDQYVHASLVDGAILAKSRTVFFRHNNPLDLERKLLKCSGKKLVVVEGVYSMDGDVCELPEIMEVCRRHGARILIDEAHDLFLFGPYGRGVAEHFGLGKEVDFHLGTFATSLGGQGGFLCGSRELIDYVNMFARSRFFSCNVAPFLAAGLLAGIRIVEREPHLRTRLWSNVAYMRRRFAEEGLDIGKSTSQVMPVLVKNDAKVFAVAEKIQERGLYLQPVTYPAVPKHRSRLRVSVSAAHAEEDLEFAVQTIASVMREERLCR